jgi:hypothetical protein
MPSVEQKYSQWRADYVRSWGDLIYIDYNKKGEVEQANAITCSEGILHTDRQKNTHSQRWDNHTLCAPIF